MLSLLILAGGESSRMGSPKALLKIGDETFVQCIARKGKEAGIHSFIIVTGPDHEAIVQHVPTECLCVKNEDFKRGQISSLQAGVRQVPLDAHGIIVWPVDQPVIQISTVLRLIDSFENSKKSIIVPVYLARRGHPVIYGRECMQWALELKSDQTGKDLHKSHWEDTMLVEVVDPGILIDIDTPNDYRRYVTT